MARAATVMRVGIDLASEAEVRVALAAHGRRYLHRIFTERELADCCRPQVDPRRLACLVAAKEAAFKVLRVDDQAIAWTDVEVRGGFSGRPELWLAGAAANLARSEGIDDLALSLTRSKGVAVGAVVIARHFEQHAEG